MTFLYKPLSCIDYPQLIDKENKNMKLRLEIPSKENAQEIEKVYEAETFALPFGLIDEVLAVFDVDEEDENNVIDNSKLGLGIVKAGAKIRPLILQIFPGLTKEELKRVDIFTGIVPLLFDIFNEAKAQLADKVKKAMMGHKK